MSQKTFVVFEILTLEYRFSYKYVLHRDLPFVNDGRSICYKNRQTDKDQEVGDVTHNA